MWYLVAFMCLFNGITLFCVGIMGEYVGRIYEEVRNRPKYMIARSVNFPSEPVRPGAGNEVGNPARPAKNDA